MPRSPAIDRRAADQEHRVTQCTNLLPSGLEEAESRALLSPSDSEEITLADLVIRGKQQGAEVYLVTEISWGVGPDDVQRAATRATLLAKIGVRAIPAVAGEWVTPEAQQLAPRLGVWQFTPSRVVPPSS